MCCYHSAVLIFSIQVPLGVLDENETSYEGMIRILEALQKYVPSKFVDMKEQVPGTDLKEEKVFITTLVGGDLLSAVRARGAIYIRSGSELQEDRLKGLLPVSEDWHAKVCLLEVSVIILTPLSTFSYVFIIIGNLETFVQNKFVNGTGNTLPD